MTDLRADAPVRKPKPKPGAWAPGVDVRDLPVAMVPTSDERVVRSLDLIAREAELLDQGQHATLEVVTDTTYVGDSEPGRVGDAPVAVVLPGEDRAGIPAAHRDDHLRHDGGHDSDRTFRYSWLG